ncbi:radical SAM protein [Telmatocola sphagniphila]|uniref:Radical SAM protein n=1 Tax=Telmatocola sphagniphila TaxID=1123043 RepID=A0A8E6B9J4_9BACT|nr:radical SAM/SPASM domain-containing protein [Telmatocola sphagniphila]QVL34725.1 radical SAM protein [Telmatocola sphagniphila]
MSANAKTSRDFLEIRRTSSAERTFRPNYLSFAGTYQCNLECPHCCVPIEWKDRLPIDVALRFLESCHALGIGILGFTGGEPFIYPEFVIEVTRRAAELGFRFDKVMTNGVWFETPEELETVLTNLRDAGFRGKIGLSIDKFHGIHTGKLVEFCKTTRRIFNRDNILSLSYASPSPEKGLEPIRKLAESLDAVIEWSEVLNHYLLVSLDLTMTLNWNHLAAVERAEKLPSKPWDGEWFEEDYCEGPGQAFIVNPKGDVKPCCGFASDLDQLTIGNIHHQTAQEILEAGRNHPFVGHLFRHGLSYFKDQILQEKPEALPGQTSNHCYFCWHILTRGLVHGLPGGGGQIGNWTGSRENAFGELVSLGTTLIRKA